MSRKTKPFSESILLQLKKAEENFSKNKRIGQFINHFVTEVKTITETIITTDVPKEHIGKLIVGLETFFQVFEDKYPREEDGCGGKKERAVIEQCFKKAIASLKERIIL